jgi:hypothetical protein
MANEQAQAAAVGRQLKRKALNELVNKESELERSRGIAHRLLRLPAHGRTAICIRLFQHKVSKGRGKKKEGKDLYLSESLT